MNNEVPRTTNLVTNKSITQHFMGGGINCVHSPVVAYCAKEVRRQGRDVAALDGIQRVGWMLYAWAWAVEACFAGDVIGTQHVERLGKMVEPGKNEHGFRRHGVRVGQHLVPISPEEIEPRLTRFLAVGEISRRWSFTASSRRFIPSQMAMCGWARSC
jgi:hypothetical protein